MKMKKMVISVIQLFPLPMIDYKCFISEYSPFSIHILCLLLSLWSSPRSKVELQYNDDNNFTICKVSVIVR